MITVLYFANLREMAQKQSEQLELADITVGQLKEIIADMYHVQGLDTVFVAVNEEYADNQTVLNSGDTIALIPPLSGG